MPASVDPGRRLPPILWAVLLAPVAAVLGVVGHAEADPALSFRDTVYLALQLFALEGGVVTGRTPWQLDVARFLAPLAVVYAAVVATVALLRGRYDAWRVRLLSRRHVVVVGLGDVGVRVVRGLRQDRRQPVVALELDPRNPHVAAARASGARVVVGDATSTAVLARLGLRRAQHVVVASGDDSLNLEVAAAVRAVAGQRRQRLGLHVLLDHLELWRELNRLRLLLAGDTVNVEHVHLPDRAALQLLDSVLQDDGTSAVLVDGDSALAARVATHVARRALCSGRAPQLAVGDALRRRLAVEEPWLEQHLPQDAEDVRPDVVLVCSGAEGDAASIAAGLRLAGRHRAARVLVTVEHESAADHLVLRGSAGRVVQLVPPRVDELGGELVELSALEVIARARHEGYVAGQRARGVRPEDNSSLRPWAELPESLQLSNRRYAESVVDVLGRLGAELVPLTGAATSDSRWLDAARVEELAEQEHERWVRDLLRDGWKPTDGPKDPDRRLHPLLVPWARLSDQDREKDRQSVRDLPAMLGRLGYELVLWPAV